MSKPTVSSLNLLVPLDGSPLAEQALPLARMLADLLPTSIHLLRVIPPTLVATLVRHEAVLLSAAGDTLGNQDEQVDLMREALQAEAEAYLEHMAGTLVEHVTKVDYEVAFGTPAEQIVGVAARHADSTIVMATHGKGGLLRWALGSVTARVLQTTGHPVLVARGVIEEPKLRRVMVALDGSLTAERALPLASSLARAAHADVLLTQVIDPVDVPIATLPASDATGRLREMAFAYLDKTADQITRDVGHHVTTSVPVGHVAEEIVEEAARKRIDLIVLGRHGLGTAPPAFLGGTAEKISQSSSVPILVAG